jgi:hypothetical protein
MKEIKSKELEDPVFLKAHDPNDFEFIRKKRASISNEFLTPEGKYFYSKKLNFNDRDYITIYSTNT